MIKARGRNFKLKPNEIVPLILMGLLVSFSSLALFQSYNYMEAGIASTLLFVYPILVALIMAFVFKEKLTLQTIFCILLALGGIGLLYKSGDGTTLSLTGVLLVMASALSYRRRESSAIEEYRYVETYVLCLAFRNDLVFSPYRFRQEPSHCP